MRILIVAHGHPALSLGGGEIAAQRQVESLRALGHEVLFLARAPGQSERGGTPFTVRAEQPMDVLFHSPDNNHFLHSQRAKWTIFGEFRALLERFRPEICHFHHYVHLGVEFLREARDFSPTMPIVLTLHEMLVICENHGQMVRTRERGLCERATPADCHDCFPEHSPQDFYLRERFIRSHLLQADRFICPSAFLRRRYVEWGLPPERIIVLENGQPPHAGPADDSRSAEALSQRFAFFGQISNFKGIFVLLSAMRMLAQPARRQVSLEIHGTLQHQSEPVRDRFSTEVAALGKRVAFAGPYRPKDLDTLMRSVGWVVVPSIWWENSPLVIQEAFARGRPVLCADIGGMAEKVRDGVDGLHFRAGSAHDLALTIQKAADPVLWRRLCAGIRAPEPIDAIIEAQLRLYEEIAAERAGPPGDEAHETKAARPRRHRTSASA